MPLNNHKWLPETRLEIVNFGEGTIIVKCHAKGNEDDCGKVFEVGHHESKYVLVKDLFPPSLKDPSLMKMDEYSLSIKNVGDETTQFNIFEEGPFKHKTFVHPLSPSIDVITLYAEFLNNLDKYSIKECLQEAVADYLKQDKEYYPTLCLYRAKMYAFLNKIEEADAWLETGANNLKDRKSWRYNIQWALILAKVETDSQMHESMKTNLTEKAFVLLDQALTLTNELKFKEYHTIGINCLKAFMLCCLDRQEDIPPLFSSLKFRTLKEEEFMDQELDLFFELLVFGFSTAIEQKHAGLMFHLCRLIAISAPEILDEPSPTQCMHKSLMHLYKIGRSNTNNAFAELLRDSHLYQPKLPNFRLFNSLACKDDDIELESFIPY